MLKIKVHAAGKGIGHHERRRGKVVGAHLGVDAAFEVAVAAEDGGHHQAALGDRPGDRGRQRAAVADAGRAAVPHQVEPEPLQGRLRPAWFR